MRKLKRYLFWASIALSAGAVIQELSKPEDQRTWHGTILGVPYDFRRPSLDRFLHAWWNPNDQRVFTPRDFGVGWAVNIPRVLQIWRQQSEEDSDDGV